jgi:hypothetical protein
LRKFIEVQPFIIKLRNTGGNIKTVATNLTIDLQRMHSTIGTYETKLGCEDLYWNQVFIIPEPCRIMVI